jgi:[protein-PII] uridylyltransferase
MNQYDVLGGYLPEFARVVGQMQHDLYHVYTVDQPILMVLRNLRRFTMPEFAHEFPLCSQLMSGSCHHVTAHAITIIASRHSRRSRRHRRTTYTIATTASVTLTASKMTIETFVPVVSASVPVPTCRASPDTNHAVYA